MPALDDLNPQQRAAVEATEGPVLVLAGPGSGKTRVIVYRIAHLIEDVGTHPFRILAVTFTNKAAREMRDRLETLLPGRNMRTLSVGTFHSTCARWLRMDGERIGIPRNFVIFDDADQLAVVKQAMAELELDEKQTSARGILSAISAAKSDLIGPDELETNARGLWEQTVARLYRSYQSRVRAAGALDFDDLLVYAVRLFRQQPAVLNEYQDRYTHILVDEFQDTNTTQYQLVRLLASKHRNVCIVGDEDQSIYGWRKADARNIARFEEDFPGHKTILLEQNYRSSQAILDVAHAVIDANLDRKPKRLWTENPPGPRPTLYEAYNEQDEALYVVRQIEALRRGGAKYGDMAVTYRTNAQSRAIEDAMVRYGLPYRLVGGVRFYQRREVKDVLAYLRLIQNPDDDVSFVRVVNVPARAIGERSVSELGRIARELGTSLFQAASRVTSAEASLLGETPQIVADSLTTRARRQLGEFVRLIETLRESAPRLSVTDLLDAVLVETRYEEYLRAEPRDAEERWSNVQELRTKAADFDALSAGRGLGELLEEIALVQDVDSLEGAQSDAVTLITMHAAKGLEYRNVFIVGLEEGICPHARSMEDPDQMAEERRLLYVGVTRAMERLYLTHAYARTTFGAVSRGEVSRFLTEIPSQLFEVSYGSDGGGHGSRPAAAARFGASRTPWTSEDRWWETPSRPLVARRSEQPSPSLPDVGILESAARRSTTAARPGAARAAVTRSVPSFARGDRVTHADYGIGTVLVSSFAGPDELVLVKFDVRPEKPKNLSLAIHKLERA
ncbi:MAG: UvrD-helicase domain-containing protein [Chloroflexota bacterium]